MKIGIASDHAGFKLKEQIKEVFSGEFEFEDFGTNSEESTDYPDYAHQLALAIEKKSIEIGIAICGSGNGINMTMNKHQHIRAALCWTAELAELARQHNNANVISIPARFISKEIAFSMVETFLHTEFEGGRHQQRVDKIACA